MFGLKEHNRQAVRRLFKIVAVGGIILSIAAIILFIVLNDRIFVILISVGALITALAARGLIEFPDQNKKD